MPFYELIFETGAKSVAMYEDDDECLRATQAHHLRAVNGESALASATGDDPQSDRPAERIVKVLKYDQHPGDYMESQALDAKDVAKAVTDAVKNAQVGDLVSVPEVAAAFRELTSPVVADAGRQDSMFKLPELGDVWVEPSTGGTE
jgi:hypothetical protein